MGKQTMQVVYEDRARNYPESRRNYNPEERRRGYTLEKTFGKKTISTCLELKLFFKVIFI
jgi:hypothetical protein